MAEDTTSLPIGQPRLGIPEVRAMRYSLLAAEARREAKAFGVARPGANLAGWGPKA